jgi:hypothetical protein
MFCLLGDFRSQSVHLRAKGTANGFRKTANRMQAEQTIKPMQAGRLKGSEDRDGKHLLLHPRANFWSKGKVCFASHKSNVAVVRRLQFLLRKQGLGLRASNEKNQRFLHPQAG